MTITISSTSNGRNYSAYSEEKLERERFGVRQRATFAYEKPREWNNNFIPAQLKISVAYNAVKNEESLDAANKHLREGKITALLAEILDVCLLIIEQDNHLLSDRQFDQILKILAVQSSKKRVRQLRRGGA